MGTSAADPARQLEVLEGTKELRITLVFPLLLADVAEVADQVVAAGGGEPLDLVAMLPMVMRKRSTTWASSSRQWRPG